MDEPEASERIGRYAAGQNPNGSVADVAGVANERGNVVGLMPHPEHAVDPPTGSADGLKLFDSLVRHRRGGGVTPCVAGVPRSRRPPPSWSASGAPARPSCG